MVFGAGRVQATGVGDGVVLEVVQLAQNRHGDGFFYAVRFAPQSERAACLSFGCHECAD
jgi:hypothetical protein